MKRFLSFLISIKNYTENIKNRDMSNFLKSIEGHTPGPFKVKPDGVIMHIGVDSIYSVATVCTSFRKKEIIEANKNLFVKSYLLPDIYKLLERAKGMVSDSDYAKVRNEAKQLLDKLNS